MSEKNVTVEWVIDDIDDPMIQFNEVEEAFELDKKVAKFLKDNPVKEGDQVVATIEEGDEINVVTKVVKKNSKTKKSKEEKETSNKKSENKSTIKKVLTVGGVSVKNKSVIFKEEEKVWYNFSDSIDVQEVKDTMTGQKVEVEIEEVDGKNNNVTNITLVNEVSVKENKQFSNTNYIDNRQKSIEAQAAVNSSNRVVTALSTPDDDPDTVLMKIKKIAKHNFNIIQELKGE